MQGGEQKVEGKRVRFQTHIQIILNGDEQKDRETKRKGCGGGLGKRKKGREKETKGECPALSGPTKKLVSALEGGKVAEPSLSSRD